VLTGIALIGLHFILFVLSSRFAYGGDPLQRPLLFFVALQVFCGVLFLLVAAGNLTRDARSKRLIAWVIAVGIGLRVCMLASTPILEDDYYRYLWDGAVTAHGVNPYSFAPTRILEGEHSAGEVPTVLFELAEDSGTVLSRINHPYLRTIYPPMAQAAFALAYGIRPWSLAAWRLVLFVFDIGTLMLIIMILRTLRLPLLYLVIYWWNPLLVKEIFNSGHMDVLILPFVLGAILLTLKRRTFPAVFSLALAMGAKLWPVVLLPLILRPAWRSPKQLCGALALFAVLSGCMFFPILQGGLGSDSGFVAYGHRWEMNDALFMVFLQGANTLANFGALFAGRERLIARAIAAMLLVVWIGLLSRKRVEYDRSFCEKCLFAVTGVFILSPAQFPWYYVWMLPLLALRPRLSLLLWTVLLPLYYFRFYFLARDSVHIFDTGIVWLEHAPVWGLLIWEWYTATRNRTEPSGEISV
jgi:hypothetical protein